VRIPTLEQVVELAEERSHHKVHYNIEIKTTPSKPDDTAPPEVVAEQLVAAIRAWGIASRTTIQSFDWRGLRRVAVLAPELPRSCLTDAETTAPGSAWNAGLDVAAYGGSVPELVHAFGCRIWSPDADKLTLDQIHEAHALQLAVLPWTVNSPELITRLLGWGVDGIISDFPDRLPKR
jgi:glycerophosphoryl diester phosphodiesterase